MVNRFVGSGRQREGGFPATHKQDFNSHVTGGDWRHTADQIDVSPSILGGTNVQSALELIQNSGENIVYIGDGYENCSGNLSNAFTNAFSSSLLTDGGVIVVKSGTYCMQSTVNVPNGISIVGQPDGTTIIGEMADTPMFSFQASSINPVEPSVIDMLQSATGNYLVDLKLYDNLNSTVSGGAPSMPSLPMIQVEHGSNVTINNCYIVGRVETGTTSATHRAVGFKGITSAGVGTILRFVNNNVDGVKTAIDFDARQGNLDYLFVQNNTARTFGDAGSGTVDDRFFISMVNSNAVITNNFHNGVSTTWGAAGFIYLKNIAISNNPTSMNIQGNSGGLDSAGSADFFVDGRAVQDYIRIINVNNWGTHHSDTFSLDVTDDLLTVDGDLTVTGSNIELNSINWPTSDGTNTQVITTNGSGTLGWSDHSEIIATAYGVIQQVAVPGLSIVESSGVASVTDSFGATVVTLNDNMNSTGYTVAVNAVNSIDGFRYFEVRAKTVNTFEVWAWSAPGGTFLDAGPGTGDNFAFSFVVIGLKA